jgi:predicted nuclease of predicted toxin-antitoxin system
VKILIDMSLSPLWVEFLAEVGLEAVHWSELGRTDACDVELLEFAAREKWVVFSNDFAFGAILAASQTGRASVIQVRRLDILPSAISEMVVDLLRRYEAQLAKGVLVVIDAPRHTIRMLEI